jgi:5'-3' exonuclease
MAGCEYVENIERVGLKVALKHFEKSKTFEQVMLSLMKSPNYKRRIPEDYVNKAVQAA